MTTPHQPMNIIQQVIALFKVKNIIDDEIKEIKQMNGLKSGWKTSEFWMQLATQAGVLWAAVGGFVPPKWAAIITVAGTAVYTIGRTIAKAIADIQATKKESTTVTTTEPVTTVTTPA